MNNQADSLKRVTITISPEHGEALRALSLVRHKSQKQILDEIFSQSEIIRSGAKLLQTMRCSESSCTPGKPLADLPKQPYRDMPPVPQVATSHNRGLGASSSRQAESEGEWIASESDCLKNRITE